MIWIGGIICLILTVGMVLCRNYGRERIRTLNQKEHGLKFFYPMCLRMIELSDKYKSRESLEKSRKIQNQLRALNLSADKEEDFLWYRCKKMSLAIMVILGASCFCILAEVMAETPNHLSKGQYLSREEYGNGEKEIPIHVTIENLAEENISVPLAERYYTQEEKMQKLKEAKEYVTAHYLGENEESSRITANLNLMKSIPDNRITISWNVGVSGLVEEDGTLHNETVENKKKEITLTASFSYQGIEEEEVLEEVDFPVTILEKDYTQKEQVINEIEQYIQTENSQNGDKKQLELPLKIGEYQISYEEVVEKGSNMILVLGAIVAVLLYFMADKDLDSKMEQHNIQLMMDYPELMNKFTLLLGAGMTVRNAWGKIAQEYEEKKRKNRQIRYAYEEWILTWNEMQNGVSETAALEGFGKRIGLPAYLKFSTLLAQNLRKGSKGLLELLEYEAMDAFEERKELAKRLGEEAGTKLLMPMMLMLMIVMLIIMYPAFCSMAG